VGPNERSLSTTRPRPRAAPEAPAAVPAQPDWRAVLSLQRGMGNRATAQLLHRAPARHLARAPATVSVQVVPRRQMTGDEFSAIVDAELLGIDLEQASLRHDDLGSNDPHFSSGVTQAEVGKPLTVEVRLPDRTESETADAEARAAELSGLSESDRKAIDAEADRRYWHKRGVAAGTKASGVGEQALWERTRDEVVRDRNRVESLPAPVRAMLLPGGAAASPDRYADILRVGQKLEGFSWEDWALFQRRGGLQAGGGVAGVEKKVDEALKVRGDERKVIGRIHGTERLYHLELAFQVARQEGMKPEQYKRFPKYEPMLAELKANGFADVAEYENAKAAYYLLFRSRAVEIANVALDTGEGVINREIARYSDAAKLTQAFNDLAPVRALVQQYNAEIHGDGTGAGADAPRATWEQAQTEREKLVKDYPTLADPEIKVGDLGVDTPSELGAVLIGDAKDRLKDLASMRKRIANDPEDVLKLDRVLGLTRQELGAEDGSVEWLIVSQHLADIANREAWKTEALAIFALGFTLMTLGTGTPVVIGAVGLAATGAYTAVDELEKYEAGMAAAHSSLDPTQSLSSSEPGIGWFAFALLSLGLDAVGLGEALAAARPAIRALEAGASAAEFSQLLAGAKSLKPEVRMALDEIGSARADFRAALNTALAKFGRLSAGWDPTILADITKMAWHAARIGVRKFDAFLEVLRAERRMLKTLDLEALAPEQVTEIKAAFRKGVAEYDATRPALSVPFKKGAKQLTFGDEMMLDGKPLSARSRDDVMKQLGLTHADRGHGAFRDPRTLANEALQNAAVPGAAGMAGQWSSDEAMLDGLLEAQRRAKAGAAVRAPNGKYLVDFDASAKAGRIFVADSHLPADATVLSTKPFAGLAVTEIAPNRIRAVFDLTGGQYQINSIFPTYVP